MSFDVATTAKAQDHLRAVRAEEEHEIRTSVIRAWRLSSSLPHWLKHHPSDSAAAKVLRRPSSMSRTRVDELLRRACYDESCRRIARAVLRRPSCERGRQTAGEQRSRVVNLGSYKERPAWATA